MEQLYKIAGIVVRMDTYGRALEQAQAYRYTGDEPVQMNIKSTWEQTKERFPELSQDECEYLNTGSKFFIKLNHFQGMMLHSSAVVVDGKAYLFTAASGTGKSTHTGLWLSRFGDRAYILNDDKPALRLEDGVWYAYGTPWSGKHNLHRNERVPLAGIAIVERSQTNSIDRITGTEALRGILPQTKRASTQERMVMIMDMLDQLITQVPIWKLRCNMDPEAAVVSYEAMSGQKKENE